MESIKQRNTSRGETNQALRVTVLTAHAFEALLGMTYLFWLKALEC